MLDFADRRGIPLTHVKLQKLLYFAHARHLVTTKRPMVAGYFEAWQYGPVHPTVYGAFKSAGSDPILFRAQRVDPLTGTGFPLAAPADETTASIVEDVAKDLGPLDWRRLVEISHAKEGPWHWVVENGQKKGARGQRISQNDIQARYKYHKIAVSGGATDVQSGEPLENSPYS